MLVFRYVGSEEDFFRVNTSHAQETGNSPDNFDVSAPLQSRIHFFPRHLQRVLPKRGGKLVRLAAEDVAVPHALENQSLQHLAFLACEDYVAFAEKLQNQPQPARLGLEVERDDSFELVLFNAREPSISQVFSKCHAEGRRRERLLKRVGG